MPNGVLGPEVEPGKYEDSDIPGAPDASEAYDLRVFPREGWDCSPVGTRTITGPKGTVTKVKIDPASARSHIVYGDPLVRVDGATTCIVMTRTQVMTSSATKTYFEWYNLSCPLDNVTLLKFIKDEHETVDERTLLSPVIRCQTDWPKWALDKLLELIKAGLSVDDAVGKLGKLMAGANTVPQINLPAGAVEAVLATTRKVVKKQAVFNQAKSEHGKPSETA